MEDFLSRSVPLLTEKGIEKIQKSNIAVFGLGGVGSYCVEALVRCGVKNLTLVDSDVYSLSNLNRQLFATKKTIGQKKVEVAKKRLLEINENLNIDVLDFFVLQGQNQIDFSKFDYVIDAIDTVSGKLEIIKCCKDLGVPVISCMGTGNKLNPTLFKVEDIFKTKNCPLCKAMRKRLKELNILSLDVVYSEETPINSGIFDEKNQNKQIPCSVSFVPSVAGLVLAYHVIKSIAFKDWRFKILKHNTKDFLWNY